MSKVAPDITPKRGRKPSINHQKLREGAITFAKASLSILESLTDDGNSPTLKANVEGQKTAYTRILAELGEVKA